LNQLLKKLYKRPLQVFTHLPVTTSDIQIPWTESDLYSYSTACCI